MQKGEEREEKHKEREGSAMDESMISRFSNGIGVEKNEMEWKNLNGDRPK